MTRQEKWRATTDDRISRSKETLIEQLKKTPIVQIACEKTAVSRSTYYRWIGEDSSFAEDSRDALEKGAALVNDMAESQLLSAIRDSNMTAIIFWLKHHHKDYRNRLEIEGTVNTITELSEEQKILVKKALKLTGIADQSYDEKK